MESTGSRDSVWCRFRVFASLKLAVTLLVTLATVIAWATILESRHGAAVARWYVYESWWFIGLLGLLGINIFSAAAVRFPWKRHQIGFVVTHCGLLILLTGAVVSFLTGVDGQVSLDEGASTREMIVPRHSQITAFWVGRPDERPYVFTFDGGPANWAAGKSLHLGAVDGVQTRILAYLRNAAPRDQWIADTANRGRPFVKFKVTGPGGEDISEATLVDQQFGDATFVGPLRLQLERAATDRMLDDFTNPPLDNLGLRGRLVMYCGDEVQWAPLDDSVGQTFHFESSGTDVEIVEYLPNAAPDRLGRFTSKNDEPKNPMVELRVYVRGQAAPLRQIAFAKDPLLNLDGVYPTGCPVKFRLYHAAVGPRSAVELLQSGDGRLFGRMCDEGTYRSLGELSPGQTCALSKGFSFVLLQHLPSARRDLTFVSADPPSSAKAGAASQPAALVEIAAGGHSQQLWMRRNDPTFGKQTIALGERQLALEYGDAREPLGFTLELCEFRREMNPGNLGNAMLASRVKVTPAGSDAPQEHTIAPNEPMRWGKFTLYQGGFEAAGHGKHRTTFQVASDPGRPLKYVGCLLVCLGIALMFSMRAYSLPRRRPRPLAAAVGIAILCLASCARANEAIDWNIWRELPVQNGGRHKPLDSLAWESLRMIANRGSLVDPQSGERLDPTAVYLTMLLDWQGWQHPDRDQRQLVTDWRPLYFYLHAADRWDQLPLLRIDHPPLAKVLGVASGNRISAQQLVGCRIEDQRTEREVPFTAWADELFKAQQNGQELTEFEQKGLELAQRLGSYQNHRMGRSLEFLPIADSTDQSWVSLAHFLMASLDNQTDPTGELRQAQHRWGELARAYREQDGTTFNRVSREFVNHVQSIGRLVPDYPSRRVISLEVAYNRWAPFRIAWVAMLLTAAGLWLNRSVQRRYVDAAALAAYVVGGAALVAGFVMRITIAGRPPVTNMYESVVYVGTGVAVIGAILAVVYRAQRVLAAAATVSALALIVADGCPLILDASLRPLEPVLRSNFWLVVHVLTITASYSALALASGIANITLVHYLIGSTNERSIRWLSRLTYKSLQIGVWLLATGVMLGGVWADYAWGRFWGWDPKEVWALVALLGYLAILHARFVGWIGARGLAALTASCFALVVMSWYGVNFVLGAGLHSYGFGVGGQEYVYAAVAAQCIFVALASWWSIERESSQA